MDERLVDVTAPGDQPTSSACDVRQCPESILLQFKEEALVVERMQAAYGVSGLVNRERHDSTSSLSSRSEPSGQWR